MELQLKRGLDFLQHRCLPADYRLPDRRSQAAAAAAAGPAVARMRYYTATNSRCTLTRSVGHSLSEIGLNVVPVAFHSRFPAAALASVEGK